MNETLVIYRSSESLGIAIPEETAGESRGAAAEILREAGIPDEANVEDTGLLLPIADLTKAQAYHLKKHGWCPEEEDADLRAWFGEPAEDD